MALILGCLLGACGDDDGPPGVAMGDAGVDGAADAGPDLASDQGAAPDGGPAFSLAIAWSSCSLITEGTDARAECATVEVPLDWEAPEGETITLFVKRHRGTPGAGQTFFLTGGPGQTSADLEPLVEQLITFDAERSYTLLDHRGVGRSTRLRCPSSEGLESPNGPGLGEGEVDACVAELAETWSDAQLAAFSSSNAARDLGELIAFVREPGEEVTLWGGSYGTHWMERYLARYADQPSAVVFSAIALDVDLLSVDRYVDDLSRRWLDACDADAACGARFQRAFARSAREVVEEALGGADAALCAEMEALELSTDVLKPFFGQLFNDRQGRSLFLPLAYRLARCAPEDVRAMEQVIEALEPPPGPPALPFGIRNWGFVLSENIAVSELTRERARADVESDYAEAIAVQGPTPRLMRSKEIWPRYDAPPFASSDYAGPMLLLHGEYDFLPPEVYTRTVDHYLARNPRADFVRLPGAPHSLESPTEAGVNCGLSLVITRLLDPEAPVEDCASRVLPLAFAPDAPVSFAVFGTSDPWDGVPLGSGARLGGERAEIVVRRFEVGLPTPPFAPAYGWPSLRLR
ncbi:MAG: hypothetical protein AAF447_24550 [Myxococcota bacterium]